MFLPVRGSLIVRRNLRQRLEHERAFREARMRDDERWRVDDEIAVEDEIEVERARRADAGALAAALAFERQELAQQRLRRERRLPHHGAVQKRRLRLRHVDGLGLDERRHAEVGQQLAQSIDRPFQMRAAVTEIRAEGNGC